MIGDNKEIGAFSNDANNNSFLGPSQSFDGRHCSNHVFDHLPPTYSLAFNSTEMKGCKGEDYSFPVRLHYLLDVLQQDGNAHLASWQVHGRCFIVHNPNEFSERVLPLWFRQSRFGSFQRQLNLYGFKRMKNGRDKGGYYHEHFIRGQPQLTQRIKRSKVKKSKLQEDNGPEEPNFYDRPFVPLTYPSHVIAVQPYAGPNSHYAPLQQVQQVQPVQEAMQPAQPSPPTTLPPNPPVTAPQPHLHPGALRVHGAPAPFYADSSVPILSTIPHFDAEDMPVIPNENLPGCPKQAGGPGPIDVPLMKSKLLQSPTAALTPCLAFAARSNSFNKEDLGALAPATAYP